MRKLEAKIARLITITSKSHVVVQLEEFLKKLFDKKKIGTHHCYRS